MSAGWERLWYPERPEDAARKLAMAPLSVAALAFGAAVRMRNALYDRGALAMRRVDGVRVISIGNLTVGGTGKTPVAIHLANQLGRAGEKVAVVSRGYGRTGSAPARVAYDSQAVHVGDEPLLIARRCPRAAVWVGADRVAVGERARDEGAQVILLDDGMQHRRLVRDTEIVVMDASVEFGNGRLLPRGPLREPPGSLARANLVWLFVGADAWTSPSWDAPTVRARHKAAAVLDEAGAEHPVRWLADRPVVMLAGIARPVRFRATLEAAGGRVVAEEIFPDHHRFSAADLARARERAVAAGATIVTTEKDAVRLPPDFAAAVVRMEIEIVDGAAELARVLA